MKKLTMLVAIVLFVAAMPVFVSAAPMSQYDKTSNAIVGLVALGSYEAGHWSVGPLSLTSTLSVSKDTTSFIEVKTSPGSSTFIKAESSDQTTSGSVSFIGTFNPE